MTTMRRKRLFLLLGAAILFLAHHGAAQSGQTFKARLSTMPIDATTMSTIAGSGSLIATLAGRQLTVAGTFEGLHSAATTAQLRLAPKGLRGPALFELTVSKSAQGAINGRVELTAAQVDDLKNGRIYVQLQSVGAPEGNLRGWILP